MSRARIFISHAGADIDIAEDIHRRFSFAGYEAFLDHHRSDGIQAGEDWEDRLHERLRWSDAVVCIVSRAYSTSVWCAAEIGIARSRVQQVVPLRVALG